LRYAAEAATGLQWSRLSGHIGRKPILLFSFMGTTVSTIVFGLGGPDSLSGLLWALILSLDLFLSQSRGC
jgi:hypothetical protein